MSLPRINENTDDQLFLHREDSLEYFIKFPSEQYRCSSTVIHYKTVPVILLFGWAGCEDRYLMKYSKIYEDQELITIRYTAPVEYIFWNRDGMKLLGQKIVKLLYDMNFVANPIIVHVFSNGGAYLYQHLDLAMKELQVPLEISGIIFDSAPGVPRFISLYRAISSIYGKNGKFVCLMSIFITVGLAARWIFEDVCQRIKNVFSSEPILSNNPYKNLRFLQNQIPQLFLYSNTDKLIPSTDVEKFAKSRLEMGVPVEKVCFDNAEHVKLFLAYPQKYVECIFSFINNCLKNVPQTIECKKND